MDKVKSHLGLSFLSLAKSENASKKYSDLKKKVANVAADFYDINNGILAQRHLEPMVNMSLRLSAVLKEAKQSFKGILSINSRGKFILSPEGEYERYDRIRALLLKEDLSSDEQRVIDCLSEGIKLPNGFNKSEAEGRIRTDIHIVNCFNKNATYNDESRVMNMDVLPETNTLARQAGLVIRSSKKAPSQLTLIDRKAHLDKYIIR